MAIDSTLSVTDRIAAAETRIFKAVFPNTTNHYDTLFGGTALQLMDETVRRCGRLYYSHPVFAQTHGDGIVRQDQFHQVDTGRYHYRAGWAR